MGLSDDLREKRETVQSEARDKTVKLVSSFVPFGSQAYELLTTIVVPLHERKKKEFLDDLASRIYKLEQEGTVNAEVLAESEEFNTIITKAILLAQQNHQEEKLEAFKTIVVNAALNIDEGSLAYEEEMMFLRIIDQIESTHLIILNVIYHPHRYSNQVGKQMLMYENVSKRMINLIFALHPELKNIEHFISQIWIELYNFGLVSTRNSNETYGLDSYGHSTLITDLGKRFMDKIRKDID